MQLNRKYENESVNHATKNIYRSYDTPVNYHEIIKEAYRNRNLKGDKMNADTYNSEPRSTAYYYADLEKLKRNKTNPEEAKEITNELSEYVDATEVVNDGAVKEVPPLRDRQWSLPEYNTPENGRKPPETYSTAGTFPMPETKEKEPLLAELEVVGRLPLTQLDNSSVRRSRSWYLCCPNTGEEEISRESSWRYSSLRPVTAPPAPGQNGLTHLIASQTSAIEDVNSLRAERDALARALAAERQRAAALARAHDARLAELHGVIAELVRRRAADKTRAIPEEEVSDECESTTQPAGELDNDADQSRTEQNATEVSSSESTPRDLPELSAAGDDNSTSLDAPQVEVNSPQDDCETSLNLSERDSDNRLSTSRIWRSGDVGGSGGSCERQRGSPAALTPPHVSGCEARQTKVASRVRLRRTEDIESDKRDARHSWCLEAAEQLALDVRAQADLREAIAAASEDGCAWRGRCALYLARSASALGAAAFSAAAARRATERGARAAAAAGAVCAALAAADGALEAYDVLLALAEAAGGRETRASVEAVAWRVLRKLESPQKETTLLPPGPWMRPKREDDEEGPESWCTLDAPRGGDGEGEGEGDGEGEREGETGWGEWGEGEEQRLRAHAAALKAATVALRQPAHNARLFSHHDTDDEDAPSGEDVFSMADMEAAVALEEMMTARISSLSSQSRHSHRQEYRCESSRRRRRERHWHEARASETDL